jgi:hypothetical protein
MNMAPNSLSSTAPCVIENQGMRTASENGKDDLARQIEFLELVIKLKLYQAYISQTASASGSVLSLPWLHSSDAACQDSPAQHANAAESLDDRLLSPTSILRKQDTSNRRTRRREFRVRIVLAGESVTDHGGQRGSKEEKKTRSGG